MADPLNWAKAAAAMGGSSHLEEVKRMVAAYIDATEVEIEGETLTVGSVAAVARRSREVRVVLDATTAKSRVDSSSDWVLENVRNGTEIYGVTTGFGANSNRRVTNQAAELQKELIRFLNAGVVVPGHVLPVTTTRAAILVRTNTLMQGYCGIRWAILDAMTKLLNSGVTPLVPLRGTLTASGDLMPLSYIAGMLIAREDSVAVTENNGEVSGLDGLRIAGVEPFVFEPNEGHAIVNGTVVGAALAATVCFDANWLAILAEVLSALFCEVVQGRAEFANPLTHKLKHHPGQMEAAAVMEWLLDGSGMMARSELRTDQKRQDRYALRTAPQWLGPQVEVIRFATHVIEREINSVNNNPIIDVATGSALHGGNFQGTPIGVAMDNVRLAVAAIAKLMFAQFGELVNNFYNNGLPSNLAGGPNLSLDYGLKGAEIAMASYLSEINHLANPVTTHVQSAEQHNQDVNSLGLISARKTEETIEILKLMSSTFLVALCQAIDLRHVEETMHTTVKQIIFEAAQKITNFPNSTDHLQLVADRVPIFSYIDNAASATSPLMEKLRLTLLAHALDKLSTSDHSSSSHHSFVDQIPVFEAEVREGLRVAVPRVRETYDETGFSSVPNRIEECRTYPLYQFVRGEIGTRLLSGLRTVAPGAEIRKVFVAMSEGKLIRPLLQCVEGWNGAPGPFPKFV